MIIAHQLARRNCPMVELLRCNNVREQTAGLQTIPPFQQPPLALFLQAGEVRSDPLSDLSAFFRLPQVISVADVPNTRTGWLS